MTSREFCYWLQGFFELQRAGEPDHIVAEPLNSEQAQIIQNHLNMVFRHEIDPSLGTPEHQAELRQAHEGAPTEVKNPGTSSVTVTEAVVRELIRENLPRRDFRDIPLTC